VNSGCGSHGCPTSFPAPINNAATFNMKLVREMTQMISTEARRLFVEGVIHGLDFWAPNINIFRDPRWGRGQETPGEDPVLSAAYATQFVQGLQQGEDPRYIKAIATLKHYAAYSLENYEGIDRDHYNAKVSDQDFVQTYFPAFKAGVVDGKVKSIMCSYNEVNGMPSCANEFLLEQTLRQEWGFDGYVTSDCDAVADIYQTHHLFSSPEEASAKALIAGTDLDCGNYYSNLESAIGKKLVDEYVLDKSLVRLFAHRMMVGLFDPLDQQPYLQYLADVVNSDEHRAHALQMGKESIVLLKNTNNALPLDADSIKTLALLGPLMNATDQLCSNYYGKLPHIVSPLEGISAAFSKSKINANAVLDSVTSSSTANFAQAIDLASKADVAILHVGIDNSVEAEGRDRVEISFPGAQEQLIQKVADSQKKTIVIVHGGSSLDLSVAMNHPNVVAILYALYPGEEGGNAIASVLSGAYNPSGRLPFTVYSKTFVNETDFKDMSMTSGIGRTYRFYTGKPLFEFGTGMSYTQFQYNWKNAETAVNSNGLTEMKYAVEVKNTGNVAGDVSVLAFASKQVPSKECPLKQLFAFDKVSLAPGQSADLFFTTSAAAAFCVEGNQRFADPGDYAVQIGDLSQTFTQPGNSRIYL
jgi:beta-D-xylosidase 4